MNCSLSLSVCAFSSGYFLTYPDLSCFLMASQLVLLHWLARETTNTEPSKVVNMKVIFATAALAGEP
jgi:hypothetical protein